MIRPRHAMDRGSAVVRERDRDLQVANLAITANPPLVEPAAYHCQQTAEKLFKGLLVASAIDVPRTHDLEHLATLLVDPYSELADDIRALAILSLWSVVTRYPQLEASGPDAR